MNETVVRAAGLGITVVYASLIAWLFMRQPATFAEVWLASYRLQPHNRQMSDPQLDAGTAGPLFNWTQAIYALHAFSLTMGIFGAATVVGAFLTGWPSLIAVVLNYVKRAEVRGTWLESHFRWQIRTFWYGLLWVSLCLLFVIVTLGIGILVAWLPLVIVSLWFIYRIVRGWLALRDRRPMYAA